MINSLLAENHKGFLPDRLRTGNFLKWLKRVHAWLGLWGAALGLMFGVSGFVLNHRAQLKINAVTPVESTVQIAIPDDAHDDPKDFAKWFSEYTGIKGHPRTKVTPAKEVIWNEKPVQKPAEWSVTLAKPNFSVSATYTEGNKLVEVKRSETNFWGVITNLHKGVGAGVGWILLVDTLAGALITLCITGFLLWSRLHGPRLAALGLIGGAIAWGCWSVLS
ncbi:PepSY-associated TM helix domain-containing protein [Silvimonas soli]|uniref:PepSY-associated TM helix domain-containing protein n=1 Tax=Silvimonas soli TaxID=2980100 RepID=UPI0024B375F8|nr:PepSY-associated TM helix domain-containing protein [Silvimonas soli]